MMYSKFEVVKLDIGQGERWFLFNDNDQPVTIANRYIHENYKDSLNTQERVAHSLRLLFEYLDYLYIHVRLMTYEIFMEYRQWLASDKMYRGDDVKRKKNNLKKSTIALRERDARQFLMNFIKPLYGLSFDIPRMRIPVQDDPKSKAVEIDDWVQLMSVASRRNKLIYQFLYESGVRIGELFNIDYKEFYDVPRAGDEEFFCFNIYVSYNKDQRKQPKSEGRPVWIRTLLAEKVSRYIRTMRYENSNKHHEIFTAERPAKNKNGATMPGDPLSYMAIYKAMKKDAKLAGLNPKIISPHKGRHSYATNLLLEGASETEVKTQMGHKSVATISIYSRGLTLKVGMAAVDGARNIGVRLDEIGSTSSAVD